MRPVYTPTGNMTNHEEERNINGGKTRNMTHHKDEININDAGKTKKVQGCERNTY